MTENEIGTRVIGYWGQPSKIKNLHLFPGAHQPGGIGNPDGKAAPPSAHRAAGRSTAPLGCSRGCWLSGLRGRIGCASILTMLSGGWRQGITAIGITSQQSTNKATERGR